MKGDEAGGLAMQRTYKGSALVFLRIRIEGYGVYKYSRVDLGNERLELHHARGGVRITFRRLGVRHARLRSLEVEAHLDRARSREGGDLKRIRHLV